MLTLRTPAAAAALLILAGSLTAADYSLTAVDAPPEGLSDAVAAQIDSHGVELKGPQRGYATLRLVKSAAIPADFKPSAAVRYPFTPGQLIGVLTVPRRADFVDFRGNEIEDGVYTLRYARQPMDGNHIGTSDLADFLLVIPADDDQDPAAIDDMAKLVEMSAGASGTTHPAILSLQPVEKPADNPALTHDEERGFWILQLNAAVKRGDAAEKLPVRMVIVGVSEG